MSDPHRPRVLRSRSRRRRNVDRGTSRAGFGKGSMCGIFLVIAPHAFRLSTALVKLRFTVLTLFAILVHRGDGEAGYSRAGRLRVASAQRGTTPRALEPSERRLGVVTSAGAPV